jgi:biotin transporter BioY
MIGYIILWVLMGALTHLFAHKFNKVEYYVSDIVITCIYGILGPLFPLGLLIYAITDKIQDKEWRNKKLF